MKFDEASMNEDLDEAPEVNCTVSAGYTLESVSRAIGDDVLLPLF